MLSLARHRPVILYLDNLHWADGPTWDFLGYLAQRVQTARMLVIGVARAEDMAHERLRLVRKLGRKQLLQLLLLDRLSQEETMVLVRQLMDDDALDPVFARRIYEETEGNPFFIIETTRAVREAVGIGLAACQRMTPGSGRFSPSPCKCRRSLNPGWINWMKTAAQPWAWLRPSAVNFTFELLQQVSQF